MQEMVCIFPPWHLCINLTIAQRRIANIILQAQKLSDHVIQSLTQISNYNHEIFEALNNNNATKLVQLLKYSTFNTGDSILHLALKYNTMEALKVPMNGELRNIAYTYKALFPLADELLLNSQNLEIELCNSSVAEFMLHSRKSNLYIIAAKRGYVDLPV